MIQSPNIIELPPPATGKTGWPWTAEGARLPATDFDSLAIRETGDRSWPSFSIVIPSYNQGQFIEETIRSVLLQGYPEIELIIIDGGSDDDSVQIIKRYSPWLKKWVSEPDRGQSHAINKGLRHCDGEIFNWLNSDDLLNPGALHAVASAWELKPNTIVAGCVTNFDDEGNEELVTPKAISLKNFINFRSARQDKMTWHQPGAFLPREKVAELGGVQEDLEFNMDHFLMIDLLRGCEVVTVPDVLARFRLHGQSKTMSDGFLQFRLERIRKLREVKDVHEFLTEDEVDREHIVLLLANKDLLPKMNLRKRGAYYREAFSTSLPLTVVRIIRRSRIFKFVRNIVHKQKRMQRPTF